MKKFVVALLATTLLSTPVWAQSAPADGGQGQQQGQSGQKHHHHKHKKTDQGDSSQGQSSGK